MMIEPLCDEIKYVALKDIQLDPKNPRLIHVPEKLSQADIYRYFLDEEDIRLLRKEILTDGRIHEPFLVQQTENGKYISREGNRRLVAVNELSKDLKIGKIKNFEKDHFDIVPVQIWRGSEHDLIKRLGQMHVSGKKEWKAHHKAKIIYDLFEEFNDPIPTIADTFGMTVGSVNQSYNAYKMTTLYGKRFPNDKRYVNKYSYFAELYKRRELKQWIEDPTRLDFFIDLVGKNKLKGAWVGVKALKKIVMAPTTIRAKAFTVLEAEDGDIDKAMSVLEENHVGGIWEPIKELAKKMHEISFDDFSSAKNDSTIPVMLDDIVDAAKKLKQYFDQKGDYHER